MAITFEPRQVWRGRGRPQREPSEQALASCYESARTRTCARTEITVQTSEKDIRELYADLRAAERKLGGKVSIQRQEDCVLWYWTPPRKAEQ